MSKRVGSVPLSLVTEAIKRYEQAFSLMKAIEILLEPILKENSLEILYHKSLFEPLWQAERKGELMRFEVTGKFLNQPLYLVIRSDGSVVLEEEEDFFKDEEQK